MKQYLQILIIGILIFSSNCIYQYTCSVSGTGPNDGFYNAPIGAGGICTNTGVCQGSFSETANSPKTPGTLTGDCFHCKQADRFLDRPQQVQNVRCSKYGCQTGYTDSSAGAAASYPLQGNCQHCVSGLINKNGVCQCQNEDEYLINSYSGRCGTKCDEGYVQYRNGVHLSVQFTHCLFCHYGLENNNGRCACAINGQYLTKSGYVKCGYQCYTNFTDKSDGSAPSPTITGHCFTCITGHTYYNRKCSPSCPPGQYYINFNPICGSSCAPGYSDNWFALPSSPIEGNCGNCQNGLILTGGVSGCHCRINNQYLTSANSEKCGRTCISGYTDKSDGSPPNTPSTGHCTYCLAGLVNNKGVCECEIEGEYLTSTISGTCGTTCEDGFTDRSNGGTPSYPLTGNCFYNKKKCPNGQYLRQINPQKKNGRHDRTCGITCVIGYTDKPDGSRASNPIKKDCQHCVKGLVYKNGRCQCPISYQRLMNISDGKCGNYCYIGYTYYSSGGDIQNRHCFYCEKYYRYKNGKCVR